MKPIMRYLGDSVYLRDEGCQIVLYTDNGMGPSNIIYLEPEVVINLVKYLETKMEKEE